MYFPFFTLHNWDKIFGESRSLHPAVLPYIIADDAFPVADDAVPGRLRSRHVLGGWHTYRDRFPAEHCAFSQYFLRGMVRTS